MLGASIRSSRVAWGELRTDGTLGYQGGCCQGPRFRANLEGATLVSAHAPSRLELDTQEPLEVFGILNASARFDPDNPVQFWADWNFVGELALPGSVTAGLILRPGSHVLVSTAARTEWRHTLWALRPARLEPRSLSVLTIAAYPEDRVPSELGLLARSARKAGVELAVCFVGERYSSHREMKVHRLLPVVRALDTPLVAYVDGRDSVFLAGAPRIERSFGELRSGVVVSAEAASWPIYDRAWIARFPEHPSGCRWPNAGQWMGERQHVIGALEALAELATRSARGAPALERCRRVAHDDQILWQTAWLDGLVDLKLDYDGCIFRNVNTLDTSLIDNRDFDFGEELVFRASGQSPSILHFSGDAAQHCMHQWVGFLGAV
ncbi:MAG TPA: hypothetical protein VGQ57_18970 [Polyangiaceae bacterium]|jgi:hypothetical protein|nr:hypothetical protein [Polyangiaceae bacterium]